MDREVESVVMITIEVLLCSLVISIIGVFANYGYQAYNTREFRLSEKKNMESLAELYYYNGRTVSYSDAMELILTHTRDYEYVFEIYNSSNVKDNTLSITIAKGNEAGNTSLYWSEDNLKQLFESKGYSELTFSSTLIRGVDGSSIKGVKFTSKV